MLSKHERKSRTRITAGVAGATLLTLAGLALTASGTQAAAVLRADVGDAIGVDLTQEPPLPPAAPTPRNAPAPGSREAAKETTKTVKKVRIVTRDKDGNVTVTQSDDETIALVDPRHIVIRNGGVVAPPAPPAIPDVPTVISAKCGGGKDQDLQIERRDGDKRKIIICTDRIELRAADATGRARVAEAMAGKHRAIALAHADIGKRQAMFGLKMARRSVETQSDLSDAQRSAALTGIDEAIRELEAAEKD